VTKNKGLGQGVGVLFSNDEEEELYFECNVDNIVANKYQPRTHFNEKDLAELADSIGEHGVLQPLVVRRQDPNGKYEIIAGERRFRASKNIGLTTVPVIVKDVSDESALLELALIENIQRTDLNPIEEAEAYFKLIENFSYTQEQAAKKLGKSRSSIANILRLLNLPSFIKTDLVEGVLTEGHARSLLRLGDDNSSIKEIRDQVVRKKLSVRQTESLVRRYLTKPITSKKLKNEKHDQIPSSYCSALANKLTNRLDTKVLISQNGGRGKVEIEYFSLDDLERVVNLVLNNETD
jgi:ParB family chromosome partitioning protein